MCDFVVRFGLTRLDVMSTLCGPARRDSSIRRRRLRQRLGRHRHSWHFDGRSCNRSDRRSICEMMGSRANSGVLGDGSKSLRFDRRFRLLECDFRSHRSIDGLNELSGIGSERSSACSWHYLGVIPRFPLLHRHFLFWALRLLAMIRFGQFYSHQLRRNAIRVQKTQEEVDLSRGKCRFNLLTQNAQNCS